MKRTWVQVSMCVSFIAIAGLLMASCAGRMSGPATEWPSFGFDPSNSLHNREEEVLTPGNVSGLAEAWRIVGGGVSGTPIVAGEVVYFADWHGNVHAVDTYDGNVRWKAEVADVPFSATVAVTEDLVIAGDLGGVLHALERGTGQPVWSVDVNKRGASLFGSPVVAGDAVVIGMTDTELDSDDPAFRAAVVAFDLEDGSERWRLHTDDDEGDYWVSVWSTPAYDPDRNVLYVGTGDTNRAGSGGPGSGSERADRDLPLADGVLAIDHASGTIEWFFKLVEEDRRRDFDVGAAPNLFAIGGRDVVGVGGKSGDFVVLDRDTGQEIWKTHLTEGSAIGGVVSTAAIGDGVVYVASNEEGLEQGTVFALDAAAGTSRWNRLFDAGTTGGLALANGVLYRGSFDSLSAGTVVALDAANGAILWTAALEGPAAGGLAVADGTLYVGYGSGAPPILRPVGGGLVAFRLDDASS